MARVAAFGTRVSRTYEPDDPELDKKRVRPIRLSHLKRVPRALYRIHQELARTMPEAALEPGFGKKVAEVLKRYAEMDVDLWLDSVRAYERGRLRALIPGTTCILVIGLSPREEKILLEVDLNFVYRVVSKLLGTKATVDIHRPLTEIEQGVFLFVALKVIALVQETYASTEQLSFRIEDVRSDLKSAADLLRYEEQWVCFAWKLFYDLDVGAVRALVPLSFARGAIAQRPPPDSHLAERLRARIRERLRPFRHFEVFGYVSVGSIELTRRDIEALDVGDIILVEQTEAHIQVDRPVGPAVMRVGLGVRTSIKGELSIQDGRHLFEIKEIVVEEIPPTHDPVEGHGEAENPEEVVASYEAGAEGAVEEGEYAAEGYEESDGGPEGPIVNGHPLDALDEDYGLDDENDGDDEEYAEYEEGAQDGEAAEGYEEQAEGYEGYEEGEAAPDDNLAQSEPLLGDIPMLVVVELGRVQLTADEVIRFRPGQLIEVGRSPSDLVVDLVVNGKLVAKGKLVEIEGALGVELVALVKESEG